MVAACGAGKFVALIHRPQPLVRPTRAGGSRPWIAGRPRSARANGASLQNYTDFLYRPRRPEEWTPAQGGGRLHLASCSGKAIHQIDLIRLLTARARHPRRRPARKAGDAAPSNGGPAYRDTIMDFNGGAAGQVLTYVSGAPISIATVGWRRGIRVNLGRGRKNL